MAQINSLDRQISEEMREIFELNVKNGEDGRRITVETIMSEIKIHRRPSEKVRVAVYCRVSTETQSQEESFELQKRAFEKKISQNPDQMLVEIYGDVGESGGNRKRRRAFNQMMADCHGGKIDMIMTKSISRFARNLADSTACIHELRMLGIPVIFEKEGLNTMDKSSDMIISMLSAIAQEELNHHSQNIKWSLGQKARCGEPGRRVSYGYRRVSEGGKILWVVYEPEAEKVRLIFEKASEGKLYEELLGKLNYMEKISGSNYIWNRDRIYRILKNEVYIGNILTHKTISVDYLDHRQVTNHGIATQYYIEEHHEPIVAKALFDEVQQILRKRWRWGSASIR